MKAPTSHIISATPTLPDDLNILLGVAYILVDSMLEDSVTNSPTITNPVPMTRLKIRKDALKRPGHMDVGPADLCDQEAAYLVVFWLWVRYRILHRAVLFCVRIGVET